ncbi:hypothetical protein ACJJTC_014594 [Scirpophaga incertulas]
MHVAFKNLNVALYYSYTSQSTKTANRYREEQCDATQRNATKRGKISPPYATRRDVRDRGLEERKFDGWPWGTSLASETPLGNYSIRQRHHPASPRGQRAKLISPN